MLQLSFSNYIDVGETLRYIPHPQDKNKTLLKQEAIVTVQGAPLASYMEDLLTKRISFNAGMVKKNNMIFTINLFMFPF